MGIVQEIYLSKILRKKKLYSIDHWNFWYFVGNGNVPFRW